MTNALIRLIRDDGAAGSVFELVRSDLRLWVMELDFQFSDAWASQMDGICEQIARHRMLLASLREGSSDFTLHLAVAGDETCALRIPVRMCELAPECGFEIEIYAGGGQGEEGAGGGPQ